MRSTETRHGKLWLCKRGRAALADEALRGRDGLTLRSFGAGTSLLRAVCGRRINAAGIFGVTNQPQQI